MSNTNTTTANNRCGLLTALLIVWMIVCVTKTTTTTAYAVGQQHDSNTLVANATDVFALHVINQAGLSSQQQQQQQLSLSDKHYDGTIVTSINNNTHDNEHLNLAKIDQWPVANNNDNNDVNARQKTESSSTEHTTRRKQFEGKTVSVKTTKLGTFRGQIVFYDEQQNKKTNHHLYPGQQLRPVAAFLGELVASWPE